MKILIFIGSLRSGGKERRLVELLSYLKKTGRYEILMVMAFQGVDYAKFYDLNIEYLCLNKKPNSKSIKVFFELDKIVREFQPNVIHTWGSMQTFYMISSSRMRHIPLINSQITGAPRFLPTALFSNFENWFNFKFSTVICANSYAGLKAFNKDNLKKSHVIYNGLNMSRFDDLSNVSQIKEQYGIQTPFSVVMAASFSEMKDWDRFLEIAKYVTSLVQDITFIGVGAVVDNSLYDRMCNHSGNKKQIIFPGRTSEVENLVNACDIGVLFSTNGEGISNTILEYMALGKPVIVDECGGTPEFVKDGINGFFTINRTIEQIGDLIIELCYDSERRSRIGSNGKETITSSFTLQKMGEAFERLYESVINN